MTQGTRPDGQIFASEAKEGELEMFPATARGWGVTIDGKDESGTAVAEATNGIPPMEWDNGQRNKVDNNIWWLMQHAIPEWLAGNWDAGAFVRYNSWVYFNSSETVTSETPGEGAGWKPVLPLEAAQGYLQIKNNLSEIANNGTEAQQAARRNIAATGSVNGISPDENTNITLGAADVHALPDTYTAPVTSVNTKTGAVVLTAADVHALPDTTVIPGPTDLSGYIKTADANAKFVQGIQLGTQLSIEKLGDENQMYQCPNGCVMTGTYVKDGSGKEAAYTTAYYKPIQENINGIWTTITG